MSLLEAAEYKKVETMPELRKDYVLDRFVIIASERGKRPHQLCDDNCRKDDKTCYFCPGNESMTPEEVMRLEKDGRWYIRVFPNKFPAVASKGKTELSTDNSFYTYADALGAHEIVVETDKHDMQLADLSVEHLIDVLKVYRDRISELSARESIRYVSVYKNQGEEAGCSIVHSHTQIVAYNLVPEVIKEKEARSKGACPYCDVLAKELDSERYVFDDPNVGCFTPYASMFPYEAWILPKRHVLKLSDLEEVELAGMAAALKKVLVKLQGINAPYNFYFHYGIDSLHLQLIVAPRLPKVKWAGFELSTGTIINPTTPESAAEFYRG